MNIKKTLLPSSQLKPLFDDPLQLPFGQYFSDYMFTMDYDAAKGWHDPQIKPYGNISLDPSANIFHYGQEVFEGQKAYRSPQGQILLFRPQENAKRMNRSLERMCMPTIPVDDFLAAENELVQLEARWIPKVKGTSLYLRPTVIGTEPALGVRPAKQYLFFIICSPVGPYFKEGFNPVNIMVTDIYARAGHGGTGNAKTAGNYASSLLVLKQAADKKFSQVLFLDSREHRYIEECAAMNLFFVIQGKLITPPTTGTILEGITRKSVIELAPELGITVEERPITIDEVISGIGDGSITEVFGAGTAAIIAPVGKLNFHDKEYTVGTKSGPWATKFYNTLMDIQYGEKADTRNWIQIVK